MFWMDLLLLFALCIHWYICMLLFFSIFLTPHQMTLRTVGNGFCKPKIQTKNLRLHPLSYITLRHEGQLLGRGVDQVIFLYIYSSK